MKKTITTLKGISSKLMQRTMSENERKAFFRNENIMPKIYVTNQNKFISTFFLLTLNKSPLNHKQKKSK